MYTPYINHYTTSCCRYHTRNAAITAAITTICICILVVLMYSWRIGDDAVNAGHLHEVYYGVQFTYFAIIGTQFAMIGLSCLLLVGVYRERSGLIAAWIVGCITFMAMEAVCTVYSNVLRDHINKRFDALFRAEVAAFICRAVINSVAIIGVTRFYQQLQIGITWKDPEEIEL